VAATPEKAATEQAYPGPTGTVSDTLTPVVTPTFRPTIEQLVARTAGGSYYALRARDIVAGREPFAATSPFAFPADDAEAQTTAESWLRTLLDIAPDEDVSELRPDLAQDSRRVIGEKLWRISLFELARQELESLRRQHAGDALASYQLALFFRDLGLYRSSILAAANVLTLAGVEVLQAPTFIARLAYPAYYADLILPLAERYGYDPRLQFALVRQESLFESFARSGAAAQGLAQVIPDTGAYIAERLAWPNYENEDLFKPYVGLAFGAYYLDQQLRTFDERVHVALSAYNAGPGNASRWYDLADEDYDQYLETVDFAETRLYIERIYAGFVIYRTLYQ
jgi:soluble lytic murein transglycosylase